MSSQVSIVRANRDYERAVEEALGLIGSPLDHLERGARVMIKPNSFQVAPGFQTHPDLIVALARTAHSRGARVTVSERTHNLYKILAGSDIHRYAEVKSLDDVPLRFISIENATSLRVPIGVPESVLDCDYFIGVPQLRTHASVLFSNALKNLVGLLPGYTTRIVHMVGVDEAVVDLNAMRPQHLVLCDATTVIEGNYPMHGEAREVGLVAASTNAVALDLVMSAVSGIDPESLQYLVQAHRRGMGPLSLTNVDVRGLSIAEAAFDIKKAPSAPEVPHDGIHIHAKNACVQCQRYIASALEALKPDLAGYEGELTILAGAMTELPRRYGPVILVGNCAYPHRNAGIYIEGCSPRAIQLAAFRSALGKPVTAAEQTQFRLPERGELL